MPAWGEARAGSSMRGSARAALHLSVPAGLGRPRPAGREMPAARRPARCRGGGTGPESDTGRARRSAATARRRSSAGGVRPGRRRSAAPPYPARPPARYRPWASASSTRLSRTASGSSAVTPPRRASSRTSAHGLGAGRPRPASCPPGLRPLYDVLQLAPAVERGPPAVVAAALRPRDLVWPALVGDLPPIPSGDDRGPDAATGLADHLHRMALGLLTSADLAINLDELIGTIQHQHDGVVEPPRLIHLARPVHVRTSAQRLPHALKTEPIMPRVTPSASIRRGYVGERHAQIAVEFNRHRGGTRVERIVVIEAEQEGHGMVLRPQTAGDTIVQDHAAQRANVDGPGGTLCVVDHVLGGGTRPQHVLDDHINPQRALTSRPDGDPTNAGALFEGYHAPRRRGRMIP